MDRLLQFMPMPEDGSEKSIPQWANIIECMESEKHLTFLELSRATKALCSWEIKSTSACPQDVMRAVPNLGTFFWTFCDDKACFVTKKHENELKGGRETAMDHDM